MEKSAIIALLEKYWQAETTIAEEQALKDYFQGVQIDADLLLYKDMFAYFQEESQVSAGPDFGDRILERLGLPVEEEATNVKTPTHASFRFGIFAAAAAILLIVAGLHLLTPSGGPRMLASTDTVVKVHEKKSIAPEVRITDTYDDPEKALAAVRQALMIASKNLNQGRRRITGAQK